MLGKLFLFCVFSFAYSSYLNKINVTDFYKTKNYEVYVGYIAVEQDNTEPYLFYQLFSAKNSRIDASNINPLVVWVQGGPGCSGWIGNSMEIGPFKIVNKTVEGKVVQVPEENSNSWGIDNNLLFIDQPRGVGYSLDKDGEVLPSSAEGEADKFLKFIQKFFVVYPEIKLNKIFLFGESYGGHYVPEYANKLIDNGFTLSGDIANSAIVDILNKDYISASKKFNQFTEDTGPGTLQYVTGNINLLNYRQYTQQIGAGDPLTIWLNSENTKNVFKIPKSKIFESCSDKIYNAFSKDIAISYSNKIAELLKKTRVLLYTGQYDLDVPTGGAYHWVNQIEWEKIEEFRKSEKKIWKINGEVYGNLQKFDNLCFVTVNKAGHLVPTDQPIAALDLVRKFINNNLN